jgi:hypothetical protein
LLKLTVPVEGFELTIPLKTARAPAAADVDDVDEVVVDPPETVKELVEVP